MHIHMHANMHTGTCTHGDMHMLANIFTQIHTWGTCVHIYACAHRCMHTWDTRIHIMHVHTCTYTYPSFHTVESVTLTPQDDI